jgi:hypothetical protein
MLVAARKINMSSTNGSNKKKHLPNSHTEELRNREKHTVFHSGGEILRKQKFSLISFLPELMCELPGKRNKQPQHLLQLQTPIPHVQPYGLDIHGLC